MTLVWGQMLVDPTISVVGSWFNWKFRCRFRVPYSMFLEIVAECKEHNVFGIQLRSKIKVEFKVLTCLKILGRDLCADEIEEHLKIAESTINKFFKMFIYNYASAMYSKWVNVPEGEDLDWVESTYRRMGFPGCIGSMYGCDSYLLGQVSSRSLAFSLQRQGREADCCLSSRCGAYEAHSTYF